jgi:hypothetical protein
MPPFTLNQAAKACNKSKSAILDAIRSGRLSASRDDKNQWQIEPSELFRVYQPTEHLPGSLPPEQNRSQPVDLPPQNHSTTLLLEQIERERERERKQMQETIDDLRRRLDDEARERRRLTMLLTHQPEKQEIKPEPEQQPESRPVKSLLFEKLFGKR